MKRKKLAKLGPGSYFGDSEMLDKCNRETMAVVTSSTASLLLIKREVY